MTATPIPVVIAAGGEGRRIGGGKPERLLAGRPLLDHALAWAVRQGGPVAISVRIGMGPRVPEGVPLLVDAMEDAGPVSALASAMTHAARAGGKVVLLIGCDMPFLPADLLPRLTAARGEAVVAVARSGDRWHPMAALWPVDENAVHAYIATGARSLHGFAQKLGRVAVDWPLHPFDPFFNINTAEDLAEAERIIGATP